MATAVGVGQKTHLQAIPEFAARRPVSMATSVGVGQKTLTSKQFLGLLRAGRSPSGRSWQPSHGLGVAEALMWERGKEEHYKILQASRSRPENTPLDSDRQTRPFPSEFLKFLAAAAEVVPCREPAEAHAAGTF